MSLLYAYFNHLKPLAERMLLGGGVNAAIQKANKPDMRNLDIILAVKY